jgi:hypothetical protein
MLFFLLRFCASVTMSLASRKASNAEAMVRVSQRRCETTIEASGGISKLDSEEVKLLERKSQVRLYQMDQIK